MPGKQAADPMPAHLRGRKTMRGPAAGGYVMFNVCDPAVPASETHVYRLEAPCDYRIEEISVNADNITNTPQIQVQNNGVDVVAAVDLAADDTSLICTLVEAQRNVDKGDILAVSLICVAGEAIDDVAVTIAAYTLGHVQADSDND